MVGEEKAQEYADEMLSNSKHLFIFSKKKVKACIIKVYLDSLKCCKESYDKGVAEGYEQGKNNERELQCGKKNYEKDIANLKKEIEDLKAHCKAVDEVNEKMKCGENCKHSYYVNTGGCYDRKCRLTGCDCVNCTDKWELRKS